MSGAASAAAAAPAVHPRRGLITASVMLASILYSLDWTIASIALPHMQGTFSATQDQISWVITSYIVASAVMIPTAGWLSGRFGRKRVFASAVIGFIAASVLCGAAESLAAEVLFRILQGMAGAFLVPISQAIVLDIYPREEHVKAMALWGSGVVLGSALGPTLGGFLTEYYSWRWVFYINVPLGIVALLGTIAFVPETARVRERRFDWLGFLALAAGIGALQMMLDRGERQDWFDSGEIVIEAAIVVVGLYLFVAHSLTCRDPFLNPRLLRDRNYALGLVFIFLYGLLTLAPMVMMPPFLSELRDYPIVTVGLLQSPRGLGLLAAMAIVGRIANRFDSRAMVACGFLCLTVSSWAMSGWTLEVDAWPIIWTGFLQGIGGGIIFVSLSAIAFFTLAPENRTEATSVYNLVRSVGSSIGVSIALAVLTRSNAGNHATLVEHVSPYNEALRLAPASPLWDMSSASGLAAIEAEIARQAAMIAYVNDFYLLAIASLLGLPLLLLVKTPRLGAGAQR